MTAIEGTLDALQKLLDIVTAPEPPMPTTRTRAEVDAWSKRSIEWMDSREVYEALAPSVLQAALVLAKATDTALTPCPRHNPLLEENPELDCTCMNDLVTPVRAALDAFVQSVAEGMRTE